MDDDFTTVAKVLAALREQRKPDGLGREWCVVCGCMNDAHDPAAFCGKVEAALRDNATVGSPLRGEVSDRKA